MSGAGFSTMAKTPAAAGVVAPPEIVVGRAGQGGVQHLGDLGLLGEPGGDLQRGAAVPRQAGRQRAQAAQHLVGVVGGDRPAEVDDRASSAWPICGSAAAAEPMKTSEWPPTYLVSACTLTGRRRAPAA